MITNGTLMGEISAARWLRRPGSRRSLASQVARFRRHPGGWIGTGQGWTPWIHIVNGVGIIAFALDRPEVTGR